MTHEEHTARHLELHRNLDELVADWITHNPGAFPSKASVLELMTWSRRQCSDPTEAPQPTGTPVTAPAE